MKYWLLLLCINNAFNIFSQSADTTFIKPENYFKIRYDNDFFSGVDRYYTQGILVSFIHPFVKHSPFAHSLIKLKKSNLNYYGIHLEQDVFTPVSIRHQGIFYGERPFTAVFFVSHSLISINTAKKILVETQLNLGIIGPNAKGEEEQKGIHKILNNIQPIGWQYQLSQDVIVNYNAKIEKGLISKKNIELMGSGVIRLGTLYTDLSLSVNARFGILSPYFNNLGLENNPSKRKNKFKFYLVAKGSARVVGYNATLQGGLIDRSSVYTLPSTNVKRIVAECSTGIVVTYKRLGLEYVKTYITQEFIKGIDHSWGSCGINYCF